MLRYGQSVYEGYSFGIKNRFCETHPVVGYHFVFHKKESSYI